MSCCRIRLSKIAFANRRRRGKAAGKLTHIHNLMTLFYIQSTAIGGVAFTPEQRKRLVAEQENDMALRYGKVGLTAGL